jgi:SAM-dependent methyltransferase
MARPRVLTAADQHADAGTYRRFWRRVGDEFPDLGGAASTRLYAENEQDLLRQHLPALAGTRLLKTDLWDEAKNTRILHWAARQGVDVYGLDVSMPTVEQAKREFAGDRSPFVVADVRHVPFASGSFDAIYSMGTIEHFEETEAAVVELARLLTPGGRLILGVPNRHDPFLRPLMVSLLQARGWYDYGSEKSYSRKDLRRMLNAAGLTVTAETGILFIPGWLRMLDLLVHTRWPRWSFGTRPAVALFRWLGQRFPGLRRHGYLLASVGERQE